MWALIASDAGVDTYEWQGESKADICFPDIRVANQRNISPPYEINGLWRIDVVRNYQSF